MTLSNMKRTVLGLTLLGTTVLAAHTAAPAAQAAGGTPSITAIADAWSYGVLEVAGLNFGPRDPVQIQVLESTTGVWRTVASPSASGRGTFVAVFYVAESCSAQAASQVTVQAMDMVTHEISSSVVQALGTPMTLANAQLASAKTAQQVASAQAAQAAARIAMLASAASC